MGTSAAALLLAAALLAACSSRAADDALPPADPVARIGWLHGGCLAAADPQLASGTPVHVVLLDGTGQAAAAAIEAPATSELTCKPMLSGREGTVQSQPAHYYTVTQWTDDSAAMAVGVIGDLAGVGIADGVAHIDLNGDGEPEVFAACATSEGIRFGLWAGEPYRGDPLWTGYYYLGYDLEPNCPPA